MRRAVFGALLAGLLLAGTARAETVSVAVAANFTAVAEELAPIFRDKTGHAVTYSFGATGLLHAQISQGAPFEVFIAADDIRPELAVAEGTGVAGTVFTYAVGALALYSTSLDLSDGAAVLKEGGFEKLAIADPETAPYGRAAVQALTALGLLDELTPGLVTGENVSQTLQFVETGNAELGFVAASQVVGKRNAWMVPVALYEPIEQDAVLLRNGESNPAALAFMEFLRSDAAVAVIEAGGYLVE